MKGEVNLKYGKIPNLFVNDRLFFENKFVFCRIDKI